MSNSVNAIFNGKKQKEFKKELKKIHPKHALLWSVGVSSGLRISDLLKLRGDVLNSRFIIVREEKTKKIKAFELPTEIYFEIKRHVEKYKIKPDEYLFFRNEGKKDLPTSRQNVHRIFKETAERMKIAAIGTHSMRKTFAWNFLLQEKSFEAVQESLNHRYGSTTFLYLKNGVISILPRISPSAIPPADTIEIGSQFEKEQ